MSIFTAQEQSYIRELIWQNAYELFINRKTHNHTIKTIVDSQKTYIKQFNISKLFKHKSINALEQYYRNPNKMLAEQIFYNTIYKKININ
jgi:hypothetical protein